MMFLISNSVAMNCTKSKKKKKKSAILYNQENKNAKTIMETSFGK